MTILPIICCSLLLWGCSDPQQKAMDESAAAYQAGQYERVVTLLEKAVARDSEGLPLDQVHNLRGLAYWQMGKVEEATEAFQQSRRENENNFDATYNLGVLYCNQGNLIKGGTFLSEAKNIDPNDSRALEYLASAFVQNGEYEKAHRNLKEALHRNDSSPRILTALAVTGLQKGDGGAVFAQEYLNRALKVDSHYAPALFNQGTVYDKWQNDPANAEEFYEKFLLREADSARAEQIQKAIEEIKAKTAVPEEPDEGAPTPPLGGPVSPDGPGGEPEVPGAGLPGAGLPVASGDPVADQIENLLQMARSELKAGADAKAINLCLMAATDAARQKRPKLQERALRSAVSLCPYNPKSHFAYGRYLKENKRFKEAVVSYEGALKLKPDWVDALNGLAASAIANHDFKVARSALRKAVEVEPKNADALWALALFYDTQLQMSDRAVQTFEQFIKLFPGDDRAGIARQRIKKLSSVPPAGAGTSSEDNPTLRHEFVAVTPVTGDAAAKPPEEKPPKPGPAPTRVVPSVTPLTPTALAKRYFNQALRMEDEGNVDRALVFYKKAIDRDPAFAPSHYNMGILLHKQGRFQQAASSYQAALAADPRLVDARYSLGLVYQRLGDMEKAEKEISKVLAGNPDHASAHYVLGIICASNPARLAEAREHYSRFVTLEPNHTAVPEVRKWLINN